MIACPRCGFAMSGSGQYCSSCGMWTGPSVQSQSPSAYQTLPIPVPLPHALTAARGFGQIFGLDPRIAFLTFIVDMMLFGGEVATLGAIVAFSVVAGLALGFVTYKAQMKWYGDDRESAIIKGIVVALLTGIPTPLPAILYIPCGILGLIHNTRKKQAQLDS
jgi:hypothetical protein